MPEARVIMQTPLDYVTEYGDAPKTGIFTLGKALTEEQLPILSYPGKEFAGWYTTSTFQEGTLLKVGDILQNAPQYLYAKWVTPSVHSALTSLADEVRELSGATDLLGITEMTEHVNDANTEVSSQATTIAEIAALLDGKSVPGGVSGGTNVETCSVTLETRDLADTYRPLHVAYTIVDSDGNISSNVISNNSDKSITVENVVCGSVIAVIWNAANLSSFGSVGAIPLIESADHTSVFFKITANADEHARITNDDSFGGGTND